MYFIKGDFLWMIRRTTEIISSRQFFEFGSEHSRSELSGKRTNMTE
jgi:hypothetical protein